MIVKNSMLTALLLISVVALNHAKSNMQSQRIDYISVWDSLLTYQTPEWFEALKFGYQNFASMSLRFVFLKLKVFRIESVVKINNAVKIKSAVK